MDQREKGVTFRNKNLDTEDFFTFDELGTDTFDDLAYKLWDRMRRNHPEGFRQDRRNESSVAERQPIKFSWQRPDGTIAYITGADTVVSVIHETGTRVILYYVDTIGGRRDRF